jgi:hypothetical protein
LKDVCSGGNLKKSLYIALLLGCLGCTGKEENEPEESDSGGGSGCGEVTTQDITVIAAVIKGGRPVENIRVFLDDRGWEMMSLGEGLSDSQGKVEFVAAGVTGVENCWGTVLNYWLVAEDEEGNSAEDDMNTELYNAIEDGSFVVDTTSRPLEL